MSLVECGRPRRTAVHSGFCYQGAEEFQSAFLRRQGDLSIVEGGVGISWNAGSSGWHVPGLHDTGKEPTVRDVSIPFGKVAARLDTAR